MSNSISAFYLQMVVLVVSREIIGIENTLGSRSGDDIIKDCNGILYRLMIDSGEPPFPKTACDIKQKVIHCFERSNGSGHLLDCDRFLLVQSSIVDEALMCPGLNYKKLQENIQNSIARHSNSSSEDCAVDIHQSCEKKIFEQMVVNHYPWPKTTKWRNCYEDAVRRRSCPAAILQNYSSLQEHFGERLRALEYLLGLFGIFMNDRNQQPCK